MLFSQYDIECLNKAKDLIDADLSMHYKIPEIASRAGLSATKLKTMFKEMFGMGLYHYQHEQKLQKGKYFLENTHKTIKEISRGIGYRYVNNFSIAFKKRFGKSPRELRKEAL